MRMLAEQEECLEFDPALFTAFVERVVVSGDEKGCAVGICAEGWE